MKRFKAVFIAAAVMFAAVVSVRAAEVSASISSTTVPNFSPDLILFPGESLSWGVTGTATGTVKLQQSFNRLTWENTDVEVVGTGTVNEGGVKYANDRNTYYRFLVSTITAGSFVVSLADVDDFVGEFTNRRGVPILKLHDESVRLNGDLYIGPDTKFTVSKAADQSTTATATAAVTGLSFSVEPRTTYNFEFVVFSSAAASTTGIALGVSYPEGATSIVGYQLSTSATAVAHSIQTTSGGTSIGANSAGTTVVPNYVRGSLTIGAIGGTLQLNFASEVNASNVTIRAGSYGVIYK